MPRKTALQIFIVDDHALFIEGVRLILGRLQREVSIVEAESAEALRLLPTIAPDLILLDLNLPGLAGVDCVIKFVKTFPHASIILLSGVDNADVIQAGLDAGAKAFIHKSSSAEKMLQVIHQVLQEREKESGNVLPGAERLILSPRQTEVLVTLCEGMSNKEIARTLNLSDNTVRIHLAAIFRILGVRTRAQAMVLAKHYGIHLS
jgi:two-component system nitrate/nitrite response regulator NarL